MLYLEGTAQQKELQYAEAEATFVALVKDYPKEDFAARGLFMQGFTKLLADRPHDAIPLFERFQTEYPRHELAEKAGFWRAMAYSLDKQFDRCRWWTNTSHISRRARTAATLSFAKPTPRTPRGTMQWASRS